MEPTKRNRTKRDEYSAEDLRVSEILASNEKNLDAILRDVGAKKAGPRSKELAARVHKGERR